MNDSIDPSATPGGAVKFATRADFEAWLEANHEQNPGIWLMIAKKGSTIRSITYTEAIEVALCFGWIDGQKARHDDQHWLQRFTPRSTRSRWSEINREKVEELTAVGRMRPAGIAEVERAKADGRWDAAYKGQRTASIPEDLQRELDHHPEARCGIRRARRPQPLLDHLAHQRCQTPRDPPTTHREVRGRCCAAASASTTRAVP